MTGINEWIKLAVLDFEENRYYAQNGVNRSSVITGGPLLLHTSLDYAFGSFKHVQVSIFW